MSFKVDAPVDAGALRVGGEPGITPQTSGPEATTPEGVSFGSVLEKLVGAANAQDRDAAVKTEALAAGRLDDLHGTMIAMKEADISMKLVGTVRNKLLDAFHELWRTSV